MTIDSRNKRSDGVRTVEDIRLRCYVDRCTGCWLWRGAMSISTTRKIKPVSRVWLPDGIKGDGKPCITTASKAAWILSGRPLRDGQAVWRDHCGRFDCVNPEHGKAGTRTEMHAAIAASGRLKGDPLRALVNSKNRQKMVASVDRVREAEALFAEGKLQKEVCEALRMSSATAQRIRTGQHPNSSSRQGLLRGASIFTMGVAAP